MKVQENSESIFSLISISGSLIAAMGVIKLLEPAYILFVICDIGMIYVSYRLKRPKMVKLMWLVLLICSIIGFMNWVVLR